VYPNPDGEGIVELPIDPTRAPFRLWGATGNEGFEVLLYNRAGDRFEHSPMYSHSGGQPDGTGCVYHAGLGGHAGMIHSRGYSCPRDGALEPVWSYSQTWDEELDAHVFTSRRWSESGRLLSLVEGRLGPTSPTSIDTVFSQAWSWDEDAGTYRCTTREWDGETLVVVKGPAPCPAPE
jgi:hypothetical protein